MYKLKEYIRNPQLIWISLSNHGFFNWLSDEAYLSKKYRILMGKELNLNNPKSFNEKIQWLKLYDRNPIYTTMVDKYEVKKYAASIIGEEYIVPTYGVWDRFDDIEFDTLPDSFVLKCTHDSGGIVIVKNKTDFNRRDAKRKLEKNLKRNYYYMGREWPYKNVKPRIIAEKYLEDLTIRDIRDYKFFTFNGVAKALFIASDRQDEEQETKFDFFDMDFKHLPFINGHPNAEIEPARPETFAEMRKIAEKLSKNIPHLRVDFYEINGSPFLGELTFSHWSGMMPFIPSEWDEILGEWIKLPEKGHTM